MKKNEIMKEHIIEVNCTGWTDITIKAKDYVDLQIKLRELSSDDIKKLMFENFSLEDLTWTVAKEEIGKV